MKTLTTYIFLIAIVIQPSNLKEKTEHLNKHLYENELTLQKPTTLSITKLKKPWYAWRGLIISKMKETVPEYKNVEGLVQKYYSLTSDSKFLGGIYLWKSKQDEQNWFNKEWYSRVKEKYGEERVVLTYEIVNVQDYNKPSSNEGRFSAVLSNISKNKAVLWSEKQTGLLKLMELKTESGMICYLSLWENREKAESFLNIYGITNEYFDIPLILNED